MRGETLTALGALTHLDLSHVQPPFLDPDLSGLTALGSLRSLQAVSAFCLVQHGTLTIPAGLPPICLRRTGAGHRVVGATWPFVRSGTGGCPRNSAREN